MAYDKARQLLAGTGMQRNPEESCANPGISVPQVFLQKNSLKAAENRNFQEPPKTTFL
jgi:hypothetical protein